MNAGFANRCPTKIGVSYLRVMLKMISTKLIRTYIRMKSHCLRFFLLLKFEHDICRPVSYWNWSELSKVQVTILMNIGMFFCISKIWTLNSVTCVSRKLVLVTSDMLSTKTIWIHIRINTALNTQTESPGSCSFYS